MDGSLLSLFISVFVTLFVIVDPLGTAAVFASLAGRLNPLQAKRIAIKATLIAVCILVCFSLIGRFLLDHMGITLAAFRTAGGLLLFITAFRMIMGSHDNTSLEDKQTYSDVSNMAVFPFAIPLLAGPGCMTASLLHMSEAHTLAQKSVVLGTILIVELIALVCMVTAGRLVSVLGAGGCSLLARLMGILLAAMALQFIADGIAGFQAARV
jgi:multiple antibiotic resistance protein